MRQSGVRSPVLPAPWQPAVADRVEDALLGEAVAKGVPGNRKTMGIDGYPGHTAADGSVETQRERIRLLHRRKAHRRARRLGHRIR